MGLCLLQISMSLRQIRNESTKGKDFFTGTCSFFHGTRYGLSILYLYAPHLQVASFNETFLAGWGAYQKSLCNRTRWFSSRLGWLLRWSVMCVPIFCGFPKGSDGLAANSRSICFGIPGWLLCIVTTSSDPTNTSGFGSPYWATPLSKYCQRNGTSGGPYFFKGHSYIDLEPT